jgi:hypothetical protein
VIRKDGAGKTACQETGGHAQAHGMGCREIRVIWRKLNCLNPSPQKVHSYTCRKGACNRYRPLRRGRVLPAAILRGAGAMSCQGIQGGKRDA